MFLFSSIHFQCLYRPDAQSMFSSRRDSNQSINLSIYSISECHSAFSCPVGSVCRRRFQLALSQSQVTSNLVESQKYIFELASNCFTLPLAADLVHLIVLYRIEGQLAGELARFFVDLTASRKRAFARLNVREVFPEAS